MRAVTLLSSHTTAQLDRTAAQQQALERSLFDARTEAAAAQAEAERLAAQVEAERLAGATSDNRANDTNDQRLRELEGMRHALTVEMD